MMDTSFKHWVTKGITALCTLIERGRLLGFMKLREKFGLEENDRFHYLQLLDYFNKEIKLDDTGDELVVVFQKAYGGETVRLISILCK